jgi:two-component system, NtrC family, nitrogen regulation response regulator NtrX
MSTILVIDDEPGIRTVLRDVLQDEGYEVYAAEDGFQGIAALGSNSVDLVFLDVWLPNMGGIEVLRRIKEQYPDVEVIVISGHANINLAVQAVKMGAFDFLEKPLSLEKTITTARNALRVEGLQKENKTLKYAAFFLEDRMVGDSAAMSRVRTLIEQSAPSEARILITGENGTGKELVAREIHHRSTRSQGPFVELNCAALPDSLIESELFGHEKGAFTNALSRRRGKFELAHKGTLFLDEITDMSLMTQAKVLRAVQEMRFERIGGEETLEVDVRVLCATNKDVSEEIRAGRFREDLFFRLNVVPIHVPPLRERREDLEALVAYFLEKYKRPSRAASVDISAQGMEVLRSYRWPGNIRELKNFIERVTIMSDETVLSEQTVRHFLGSRAEGEEDSLYDGYKDMTLSEAKDSFEKEFVRRTLRSHGGNITKAAEALGVYPSNLHSKIRKHRIEIEK